MWPPSEADSRKIWSTQARLRMKPRGERERDRTQRPAGLLLVADFLRVDPARFEPAPNGLGNRRSVP